MIADRTGAAKQAGAKPGPFHMTICTASGVAQLRSHLRNRRDHGSFERNAKVARRFGEGASAAETDGTRAPQQVNGRYVHYDAGRF
jgi:hypothetical protein